MSTGGAYKTHFGYKLYGPAASPLAGALLMAIDDDYENPIEVIISEHANAIALLTTLFTSSAAILLTLF